LSLPFLHLAVLSDHCWVAGALLWGVVPPGLGRKVRNSTIEATIMPRMMKNMSGLEKAGLFSGGVVGGSIVVGCKKALAAMFFSGVVGGAFLQEFLRKGGADLWFYHGESVVLCVVNVERKTTLKSARKKCHLFRFFFD
jgi:hypothetical protein